MIKYDKIVAEKLRDAFVLYYNQINAISKEVSEIIADKNNWSDEKRKAFNVHMQVINDNLQTLSKAQSEFASYYTKTIKDLES